MRPLLCALVVLSSFAMAEAQSGAPLHNASRAVKRTGHKVENHYRASKAYVKHGWRSTKGYVGHKVRGVKKAIKN